MGSAGLAAPTMFALQVVAIAKSPRGRIPMAATLAALASLVEGRLIGDGSVEILGAATLLDAGQGDITLVDKNEKAEQLAATRARAAVVPCGFLADRLTMPAIEVKDVHRAFTKSSCICGRHAPHSGSASARWPT